MYNGKHLDFLNTMHERAWEYAKKRVENNPNLCIVPDIETGYPEVWTVEARDKLLKIFDDTKPKIDSNLTSRIIMFGTGGDMEKGNFNDVFYNPENWKTNG